MRKTETKAVKQLGWVFPNEEVLEKIYYECLENEPAAPESVTHGYREMKNAFDEYLVAANEHMFRYAYQCGYEAAVAAFGKGGAA